MKLIVSVYNKLVSFKYGYLKVLKSNSVVVVFVFRLKNYVTITFLLLFLQLGAVSIRLFSKAFASSAIFHIVIPTIHVHTCIAINTISNL